VAARYRSIALTVRHLPGILSFIGKLTMKCPASRSGPISDKTSSRLQPYGCCLSAPVGRPTMSFPESRCLWSFRSRQIADSCEAA
jgi:hypothetical protein